MGEYCIIRLVRKNAAPEIQFRYAAELLFLSDPSAAQEKLSLCRASNSIHSRFRLVARRPVASPPLLRKLKDSAFRSGLCSAIGGIEKESLTVKEFEELRQPVR